LSFDWRNLLAVAAGGALGSSLRFVLGIVSLHAFGPGFPWGTLFINVSGSFAIGLVGELAIGHAFGMGSPVRLFLMVGVLGGFTTFSAFSLEALGLAINRAPIVPLAYVAGSVVLGIAFCYVGVLFGRSLIHL
jgi:CrcB protein